MTRWLTTSATDWTLFVCKEGVLLRRLHYRSLRGFSVWPHFEHTQLYSPFEKAAQLYAKNESENSTNQQHKTLKRYLAQSTQWRHIMFSESENFCRNLHSLLLTETDGNGQLNISMQQLATSFDFVLKIHYDLQTLLVLVDFIKIIHNKNICFKWLLDLHDINISNDSREHEYGVSFFDSRCAYQSFNKRVGDLYSEPGCPPFMLVLISRRTI